LFTIAKSYLLIKLAKFLGIYAQNLLHLLLE